MIDKMFKTLQAGDTIYVLKDGHGMLFHECKVVSTNPEIPSIDDRFKGIYSPMTIIAKDVSEGGETFKLEHLNSLDKKVEIPDNGVKKIIAISKEDINEYVKKAHDEAKMHISNMDKYKKIVDDSDSILLSLSKSPADASEIRLSKVEDKLDKMYSLLEKQLGMGNKEEKTI